MPFKDYYATLEVPSTASAEEIRRSFHRLALKYHPDRNAGSVVAEERFKQINEAYQVLSDSQKRPPYDLLYKDHFPVSPPHAAAHPPHTSQPDKVEIDEDPALWHRPSDSDPYKYVFVNRESGSNPAANYETVDADSPVILQCPPNLRMFSSATQVVIERDWRFFFSLTDWASILFSHLFFYWSILSRLFLFVIPGDSEGSSGIGWRFFAVFLLISVPYFGYLLTAFFLNKTRIVVDASRLDLKHGPLPLGFPFSSPSQALRQVFYRKVRFRSYSVIVIIDSWREKRLLDGLNHEEAAFVVQELKRFVRAGVI